MQPSQLDRSVAVLVCQWLPVVPHGFPFVRFPFRDGSFKETQKWIKIFPFLNFFLKIF